MTENYSFLFQYLKKEKIHIDQNEFKFQVQSHPEYPSLLAISETLSFFKINNIVTRLENKDLIHVPDRFVALIKDQNSKTNFSFIERNKNGYQYLEQNKKENVSIEKFSEIFNNIVLLAEGEKVQVSSNDKSIQYSIIILILLYLVLVLTSDFSLLKIIIICSGIFGTFLSVEAISHEFGIETNFSNAICNLNTNTDCDAVLNSTKDKFFDFSNASLVFFSSQIICLLVFSISDKINDFYNLSLLLILLSLPITLISLYQQKFIIKKWCPICLTIIMIIYVEFIFLFTLNNSGFFIDFKTIFSYSFILILSFITTKYLKKTAKENFKLKSEVSQGNNFKRKYNIFKILLLESQTVNKRELGKILFGNPDAKLKITFISSPFCSHCEKIYNLIENILEKFNSEVCIDFHFNYDDTKNDKKSKSIHYKLLKIYFEKDEYYFIKALNNWHLNKDETKLIVNSQSQISDLEINDILRSQFIWNYTNKIMYTPTIIINNYIFPEEYDKNDLIYFINDLLEDIDFINEI